MLGLGSAKRASHDIPFLFSVIQLINNSYLEISPPLRSIITIPSDPPFRNGFWDSSRSDREKIGGRNKSIRVVPPGYWRESNQQHQARSEKG